MREKKMPVITKELLQAFLYVQSIVKIFRSKNQFLRTFNE